MAEHTSQLKLVEVSGGRMISIDDEKGNQIAIGKVGNRNALRVLAAAFDLLEALNEALLDLGELENHWKNEAESFDPIRDEAEHGMAKTNLAYTRKVMKKARAAIAKARAKQD